MAAFPAVVTIEGVKVGGNTENVNYDVSRVIKYFGKVAHHIFFIF